MKTESRRNKERELERNLMRFMILLWLKKWEETLWYIKTLWVEHWTEPDQVRMGQRWAYLSNSSLSTLLLKVNKYQQQKICFHTLDNHKIFYSIKKVRGQHQFSFWCIFYKYRQRYCFFILSIHTLFNFVAISSDPNKQRKRKVMHNGDGVWEEEDEANKKHVMENHRSDQEDERQEKETDQSQLRSY